MGQPVRWAVAVVAVLLTVGVAALLLRPGDGGDRQAAVPSDPAPAAAPERPRADRPVDAGADACDTVDRAFAPRTISVPGVMRDVTVVTPPRDANGVPGVPPLTSEGKSVFAWDREQGIRPGDPAGNVLLNAHTWPDGGALGNQLLAGLQEGDRIVVHGARSRLCYRVSERVEVGAETRMFRYYEQEGPPQLAIVVCSGRRLGPGIWEKRTVWFASPSV